MAWLADIDLGSHPRRIGMVLVRSHRQNFNENPKQRMRFETVIGNAQLLAVAIAIIVLQGCGGMPSDADVPQVTQTTTTTTPAPRVEATVAEQPAASIPIDTVSESLPSESEVTAETENDKNSIYFTVGSTQIDREGQEKLRAHASRLKNDPDLDVTLVGYTDSLGSRSFNLAISERRTEVVAKLLLSLGAKKHQIRRYGLGNEKTDRSCSTKVCQKKLRRVVLIFSR